MKNHIDITDGIFGIFIIALIVGVFCAALCTDLSLDKQTAVDPISSAEHSSRHLSNVSQKLGYQQAAIDAKERMEIICKTKSFESCLSAQYVTNGLLEHNYESEEALNERIEKKCAIRTETSKEK
jgi:hypothetical protein